MKKYTQDIFKKIMAVVLSVVLMIPNYTNTIYAYDTWPEEINNYPGPAPYTRAGYWSYPWENGVINKIQDIEDANGVDELFCVPVTFIDIKSDTEISNGSITDALNGGQFSAANKAIQNYHNSMVNRDGNDTYMSENYDYSTFNDKIKKSTFKYPLYFGSFNNQSAITKTLAANENNTYVLDSKDINNQSAFYFLNNNFNNTAYACLNIVGSKLDNEGHLMSRDGAIMPYFDVTGWAANNPNVATVYGTKENNLLGFPFKDEGNGWYTFDSSTGKQNIKVYKDANNNDILTYSSNPSDTVNDYISDTDRDPGFFPFNTDVAAANKDAKTINYGFSMRMDIPFTVSSDTEEDVVFNFSGDDDVWVFVDGVLALDLGGMHAKASGSINFTKRTTSITTGAYDIGNDGYRDAATLFGEYWISEGLFNQDIFSTNESNPGSAIVRANNRSTVLDFDETKKTHTLSVFYMERGMYESNLQVSFNFVPQAQQNGLTVTNMVDDSNVNSGFLAKTNEIVSTKDFVYHVENKSKSNLPIAEGNKFALNNGGVFNKSESIDDISQVESIRDSYIYLEQEPDNRFDTSYSISDIDGVIKQQTEGLRVEDDRDKTNRYLYLQNQPIETDSSNPVAVIVEYINKIKTSSITVQKKLEEGYNDGGKEYYFEIAYNKLLGENTSGVFSRGSYLVGGVRKTATADGVIALKAGETAIIEGIPVDTDIKVTELDADKLLRSVTLNGIQVINGATVNVVEGINPIYIFTNGEERDRRLVYYSEVGKEAILNLPSDLVDKTVKVVTEEVVQHAPTPGTGDIILNNNKNGSTSFINTFTWDVSNLSNHYKEQGTTTVSGLTNDHKYLAFSYIGDISTFRLEFIRSGSSGSNVIKWFGTDPYNTGNGYFYQPNGTKIPEVVTEETFVVIDLEKSGITNLSRYGSIKIHSATDLTLKGTLTITNAWISKKEPQMGEEIVTKTENVSVSLSGITKKTDSSNGGILTIPGGKLARNIQALTFTSNSTGSDRYVLDLSYVRSDDGNTVINNASDTVEVVVYNFAAAKKLYVLDYGLPVKLTDGDNDLFGLGLKTVISDEDIANGYGVTTRKLGVSSSLTTKTTYNPTDFSAQNSLGNTLKQGRVDSTFKADGSVLDGQVVYTPNRFMSDIDTFYYGMQVHKNGYPKANEATDSSNATPVMTGEVQVMPANIVYYEDNYGTVDKDNVNNSTGIIYAGTYQEVGPKGDAIYQSNSLTMQYGYDEAYVNGDDKYSNGTATQLSSSATAVFRFRGTGFDIMSRATNTTGYIGVVVYEDDGSATVTEEKSVLQVNNATPVKSILINTYYSSGDIYQIPVVSWKNDGDVKNYIVKIVSIATESQSIYIDGIRIYNSLKGNTAADEQYNNNYEGNAQIKELREMILGAGTQINYQNPMESFISDDQQASLVKYIDSENSNGDALFMAGKTVVEAYSEDEVTDPNIVQGLLSYLVNGPNNELYVGDGYGFGFELSGNVTTLQIGVKKVTDNTKSTVTESDTSAAGTSVKLEYLNSKKQWVELASITSATEIYYNLMDKYEEAGQLKVKLKDFYKSCVILRVTGGTLSFTNLKMSGGTYKPLPSNLFAISKVEKLTPYNLTILSGAPIQSQYFKVGSSVKFTVETDTDVEELMVGTLNNVSDFTGKFDRQISINITEIENIVASNALQKDKRIWTVKMYIPDNDYFADKEFYLAAYDFEGNYSNAISINGEVN